MRVLFSICILSLGLFFSCKKKVQPELLDAQNACDCIEATSADFAVNEVAGFRTGIISFGALQIWPSSRS